MEALAGQHVQPAQPWKIFHIGLNHHGIPIVNILAIRSITGNQGPDCQMLVENHSHSGKFKGAIVQLISRTPKMVSDDETILTHPSFLHPYLH